MIGPFAPQHRVSIRASDTICCGFSATHPDIHRGLRIRPPKSSAVPPATMPMEDLRTIVDVCTLERMPFSLRLKQEVCYGDG
jgi:hypothetical protein